MVLNAVHATDIQCCSGSCYYVIAYTCFGYSDVKWDCTEYQFIPTYITSVIFNH